MTPRECDYCGMQGHGWWTHEQARADVRAWQREDDAANERQELSALLSRR
jgi:hypothetical protein